MTELQTDDLALSGETARREAAQNAEPLGVLLAMPEGDFLTAIEVGVASTPNVFRRSALPTEIDRVCTNRGLSYRMEGVGSHAKFQWTGDSTVAEEAITPALSAMDDPRLVHGPRVEFNSARDELRKNTPESRKQAVAEACNAVESAMKVLLDDHHKARSGNPAAGFAAVAVGCVSPWSAIAVIMPLPSAQLILASLAG